MSTGELGAPLKAAYLALLDQHYALRASASQVAQIDALVLDLLPSTSYTRAADMYDAFASGLLPRQLEALATSLTVGETYFFRVAPQIEALRRVVLPDLIARHATDRRLRVWSAGCSTGEEPYTLAMLISELLADQQDWDIQLVGTDLNRDALEAARLAIYAAWSFRDTPNHLRERYFTPASDRWQLNAPLRRMVRFAQLNLAEDPFPFAADDEQPDLIVCRNVTIYFSEEASQRLYRRFEDALQPSSWLVLGPSDPPPTAASAFEMVVLDGALMWRRRAATLLAPIPFERPRVVASIAPRATRQPRPAQHPVAAVVRHIITTIKPLPATSTDSQVHLADGMLRLEQGATAAAIDSLRRAAFLDETSALVQFSLGRAYREQGSTSRSRSAFFRARRLLAGVADDQPLSGGEVDASELRHAIELQLADLDTTFP